MTRRAFHMRPELPPEDALFAEPAPTFDGDWKARRINPDTLGLWAVRWHYSGNGGPTPRAYGVYGPDLAVVAALAQSASKDGLAKSLGLGDVPGNLELSRVVAHPDAPRFTASRGLALCFDLWREEGLEWVFSYSDLAQGHHGGIYQALNAVYVGQRKARPGYLLDGVPMHQRTVGRMFGTQGPDAFEQARAAGRVLERVDGAMSAKHVYVLPCGGPASRRKVRRILADHAQPYPKRDRDRREAAG